MIVTGGAKGIGAAITRALAQELAVPVILDRDTAAAESLRTELSRYGSVSHFIEIDLCSAAGCATAIERTLSVANRLNALVNNAGVNDGVGLEKGGPEEFAASLGRNLLHYYNMAHYALPSLKAAKGAIVNIASKVAFTGQGGTSGYAASKGAILALTREWAAELLPSGVRVNTIVPCFVETAFTANFFKEPGFREWVTSRIAFGRVARPEDYMGAAVFLASDASTMMTGTSLVIDGGWTAV